MIGFWFFFWAESRFWSNESNNDSNESPHPVFLTNTQRILENTNNFSLIIFHCGDDDDLQKKGHSCGKRREQFQECPVLVYPVLLSLALAPLMMTLLLFPK